VATAQPAEGFVASDVAVAASPLLRFLGEHCLLDGGVGFLVGFVAERFYLDHADQ
jgi:hypothetical protein